MDLKPLPIEEPSQTPATPGIKLKPMKKNARHHKLKRKVSRTTRSHSKETTSQKVLKDTCKKILKYIEGKSPKSIAKVSELEHQLHRAILAVQKEKRSQTQKRKKK